MLEVKGQDHTLTLVQICGGKDIHFKTGA